MKTHKAKRKQHIFIPLLAVGAVVVIIIGLMVFYQVRKTKNSRAQTVSAVSESASVEPWQPEAVNAREYYRHNAKVLAVTPVKESKKVYSEKAVEKELGERGFGTLPIHYAYDTDGKTVEQTQTDKTSDTRHPQYTVTYRAKSGAYWTVTVCEDCISAYPVSYNLEHGGGAEVLLVESESITAYDSKENLFFEVIPKPSALVLKQVPAITAETLESLTAREIEKL